MQREHHLPESSYFPELDSRKCRFFRSGTGCTFQSVVTSKLTAMKPSLRFSSLVSLAIARIKQGLHLLQEDLRQWAPKPAPVLVPIPIPAERRTHQSGRRHPARGA